MRGGCLFYAWEGGEDEGEDENEMRRAKDSSGNRSTGAEERD